MFDSTWTLPPAMTGSARHRRPVDITSANVPGQSTKHETVTSNSQTMNDLSESLLSIGEAKLGVQVATSVGYDTQALGLMAVAVGLAAVNIALMSDLGLLWWLPLIGLAASLMIGVATISQPEIETGQKLSLIKAMDGTIEERRELLITSLAEAIDVNTASLAGKRALVALATSLIGTALVLLGVAQLLPAVCELVTNTFV